MIRVVGCCVLLVLLACHCGCHGSNCNVVTDCILKLHGSCDGYTNSSVFSLPDVCNLIVKPRCHDLYILKCLLKTGEFSWCYWCYDTHSDCFRRWLDLCSAGRYYYGSSGMGDDGFDLTSVCVSCSDLKCCKPDDSDQTTTYKIGTHSLGPTSLSSSRAVSKYLQTVESYPAHQKTTTERRRSTRQSIADVGQTHASHFLSTFLNTNKSDLFMINTSGTTRGVSFSDTKDTAGTTSQQERNTISTDGIKEVSVVEQENYSGGRSIITSTKNHTKSSNMTADNNLSLSSTLFVSETPVSTSDSTLSTFVSVNQENCSLRFFTGTDKTSGSSKDFSVHSENVSPSTYPNMNTTAITDHTSKSTTKSDTEITSSIIQKSTRTESKTTDEVMQQLCQSPHCPKSDCYFKDHCYSVHKLEISYLEGRTTDHSLSMVCDLIRPGAMGLAVRSEDEVDYVARLLKYQGVTGSVLTAGVRHCCSCNTSDIWNQWDLEVDTTIRDIATNTTNTTCVAPAFYVINNTNSTGELKWALTSGKVEDLPSYVACETPSLYSVAASVNSTHYANASSPRPSPRPPPPPPPRRPPPPPRPESPSRCYGRCRQTDMYGYEWSSPCGMYQRRRCPTENPGYAWWYCSHSGRFHGMQPFYGECYHTWVVEAKSMVSENAPAGRIVKMVQVLAMNQSFFGHEIPDLLQVLNASCALHANQTSDIDSLDARLNSSKSFAEGMTVALGNLLQSDTSWLQLESSERVQLGSQLLNLSDEVGFSLATLAKQLDTNASYQAGYELDDLHVEVQVTARGQPIAFPSSGDHPSQMLVDGDAVWRGDRPCSVGVVIRGLAAGFLFPPNFYTLGDNDSSELLTINSPVVSFSVHGANSSGGDEATVLLSLRHVVEARGPEHIQIRRKLFDGETPTAVKGSAKCVYWNASLGDDGLWDDWGCRVVSSTATHTICSCDHLSTFAVLMDVHDYVGKDSTLQALSLACSGASVVCLLLTLIVFHGCRSIQSERTSIGKNLCVCLLIAHILTLTMLDRSFFNLSDDVCSVVAAFLHYFFLASFCWMWVEGHYLYRLVVRVFDSGRNLWRAYVLFGFGFPALIVSVTEIIARTSGDKAYGRDELCWLSAPIYIWAFLGPVLVLTLLNGTVVVMAMRAAVSAGMGQGKSKIGKVGVWLKGWFSLCSLLGVTWLFGVGFMDYYPTFEYVFVILNGCQGVFIFLFRCLLNTQVRRSVLNEARQRASVKRFSLTARQPRASWYISNHSVATRQQSGNTAQEDSATTTDMPVDLPPRYADAVWTTEGNNINNQSSPRELNHAPPILLEKTNDTFKKPL